MNVKKDTNGILNNTIGILTWHYYTNFGSALQAYALKKIIKKKISSNVEIIGYRNSQFGITSYARMCLKVFLSKSLGVFFKRFRFSYALFQKDFLEDNKLFYDCFPSEPAFSHIICGSDQIWAPNVFNPIYFANFADGSKLRKVSYAASIGLNAIPENLIGEYKRLLSDFSFISVREETGAQLLKYKCGIEKVEVVLDPTFLLPVSEYKNMERRVKAKKPYIFCYFLNKDHKYEQNVKKYAKEHNLKIVGWSAKDDDKKWLGNYDWIGPCEFLWLVHHADTIMTDSYHGTIFSLLFHKNFYTFERFSHNDPINQNSRIFQLDKLFNIKDRIINDSSEMVCSTYDYANFEEKLLKERKRSLDFLKRALQ